MRLRFFLAEAIRSIRANAAVSIAATVTVLIAVFILGAFIPSFLYVQSTVDSQKSRIDVRVYISDSAKVAQVNQLQAAIDDLQAQGLIKQSTYINKDEALAELQVPPEGPEHHRPRRLEPRSRPTSASSRRTWRRRPRSWRPSRASRRWTASRASPTAKETADKLLSVARFIQWAGLGLITILLVASILLIGNTIRLSIFARRREVEVMKLVGATNWFIRWPFVIEGIVCGLVGAVLSVALLWAVKVGVVDQWIAGADSDLTRDEATTIGFPALGLILIAAGAIVGALGSGITLRRFLKV